MLRPIRIAPEIGDLLRQIDRLKADTTPVQDTTTSQYEAWAHGYAASAAFHGAHLDQYMRTVSG